MQAIKNYLGFEKKTVVEDPWKCPTCQSTENIHACRCAEWQDKRCKQGHQWVHCDTHKKNIVVASELDVHTLDHDSITMKGAKCTCCVVDSATTHNAEDNWKCPTCQSTENIHACRCAEWQDKRCKEGHQWVYCDAHNKNVVVASNLDVHTLDHDVITMKGAKCNCCVEGLDMNQ